MLAHWKKSYDKPRQHIKRQRHHFANQGPSSKAMAFPVVMYECKSWTIRKAEHQRIDAPELSCWWRLLRVPWTARRPNQSILKEINPEHSFNRRADAEAEAPILWPPDVKNWLVCKDPDAGNEMVGWHHQLNGHEFEQTPGDSEEQRSLACCSPWDCKELDTTEWTTTATN